MTRAVRGVADAAVADPDRLLRGLLAGAIADCRALLPAVEAGPVDNGRWREAIASPAVDPPRAASPP